MFVREYTVDPHWRVFEPSMVVFPIWNLVYSQKERWIIFIHGVWPLTTVDAKCIYRAPVFVFMCPSFSCFFFNVIWVVTLSWFGLSLIRYLTSVVLQKNPRFKKTKLKKIFTILKMSESMYAAILLIGGHLEYGRNSDDQRLFLILGYLKILHAKFHACIIKWTISPNIWC